MNLRLYIFSCLMFVDNSLCCKEEQQLHDTLIGHNYNKLVRPKGNGAKGQLLLKIGMRLSQLLNIEWYDSRLRWTPRDYGGIMSTQIPSQKLWKPDIVLYNNADGDFVVKHQTKAKVYSTGRIVWEPPVIYKSYCPIDVEFFPFDMQECFMKFGSWTYDREEIDLQHICNSEALIYFNNTEDEERIIDRGIDIKDFYKNVEWDIINVTAVWKAKYFPCCPVPYPYIMFNITLRRRPLFYSLNLIMPCLSISGLTVLVFYLPSESGEKITLSISILLALTVFFLLLSDINPPTSFVIPLIGKYLLFTMIVVTLSIFLAVYSIGITNRKPSTHKLRPWIRRIFTDILPRILQMRRPLFTSPYSSTTDNEIFDPLTKKRFHCSLHLLKPLEVQDISNDIKPSTEFKRYPRPIRDAVNGVKFVADNLRKEDENKMGEQDWKFIAMVIDRMFLYLFTAACLCGTFSIFLYAPSLYDPREALPQEGKDITCIY